METRFLLRASKRVLTSSHRLQTRRYASNVEQKNPIGDYYAQLLESSTPSVSSNPPTTASSSSSPPISSSETKDPGPAILFSSRLSSPLERRSEIQKQSTLIAGIWVPPRPSEPDNCCMSGCVNCVWDRYGEELEEWAAATKKATMALQKENSMENARRKRKGSNAGRGMNLGEDEGAISMDDDGGGSEALWGTSGLDADSTSEDLFKGVPVGIREFMKQERRLKEKHAKEGTSGG